jgi:SAM-dependent MidA family methyltransferase
VHFIEGDSRNLKKVLPEKKFSVALSNELIDSLPTQMVTRDKKNNLKLQQVIPIISRTTFQQYFSLQQVAFTLDELIKASNTYRTLLRQYEPTLKLPEDGILLSEESYRQLHEALSNHKDYHQQFSFVEIALADAHLVPEIAEFIKRHPHYLVVQSANLETGVKSYLEEITPMLMPGGEIITIDYGNNHYEVYEDLRTFSHNQVGDNVFDKPGFIDITHDMNATTMAEEGLQLGLQVKFYGKQAQLPINHFPDKILPSYLKEIFYLHSNNSNFKVLVQSKEGLISNDLVNISSRFLNNSMPVLHSDFPVDLSDFRQNKFSAYKMVAAAPLQNKLILSESEMKFLREQLEYGEARAAFLEKHLIYINQDDITADGLHYTPKTLLASLNCYLQAIVSFKKIIASRVLTEQEKQFLLENGDLKRLPFVINYPTENQQNVFSTSQMRLFGNAIKPGENCAPSENNKAINQVSSV